MVYIYIWVLQGVSSKSYIAAVVDHAGHVALHGGVDDAVFVQPEHVASDALLDVPLLPSIGHRLSNYFSHILYDHFFGLFLVKKVTVLVKIKLIKCILFENVYVYKAHEQS